MLGETTGQAGKTEKAELLPGNGIICQKKAFHQLATVFRDGEFFFIYLVIQKRTWKIWLWFSEYGRCSVDTDHNEKYGDNSNGDKDD